MTDRSSTSDVLAVIPPDDTGSTTFSRYRYQAYVAVPLALECARRGDVVSIVMEHLEDIAIEYQDRWRFAQVKTRNSDQRPWRLRDLVGENGALRSLLRTYSCLNGANATLELWLEGSVEHGDRAGLLSTATGRLDPQLIRAVADGLGIDEDTARLFLRQVRLVTNIPPRSAIQASTHLLLSSQAPRLTAEELLDIARRLVDLLSRAMAAERLEADAWPRLVMERNQDGTCDARVDAKRLTHIELAPLVAALSVDRRPLLRRLLDVELPPASLLEEKLLAAGATPDIVRDARELRARASQSEYVAIASSAYSDGGILADVRTRLSYLANAIRAGVADAERPAVSVWQQAMQAIVANPTQYDPTGFFSSEPFIVLGELCEMSDLCLTDWGVSGA